MPVFVPAITLLVGFIIGCLLGYQVGSAPLPEDPFWTEDEIVPSVIQDDDGR